MDHAPIISFSLALMSADLLNMESEKRSRLCLA